MTATAPPVIGIAGGIGSGKSAVARELAALGCVVVDSDALGRAALEDPEVIATLTSWWGDGILDASGAIDRRAVARIVFADPAERTRLEGLTHPWIEAQRKQTFAAAPADTPALVIDAPLLFEVGLDDECDAVIFVACDRATRLERVERTRGWSEDELARREESQLPLDDKRRRADHVVQNDGDLSTLREQVHRIFRDIINGS